jgi:hypothetical protein
MRTLVLFIALQRRTCRFQVPPDPWEPVRFQVFCVFRMTVIIPGSISVTQFITHLYTHYNITSGSGGMSSDKANMKGAILTTGPYSARSNIDHRSI